MGKKSLIKSTTKKEADKKVEEEKPVKKKAAKTTKKAGSTTAKKSAAKTTKKSSGSTKKAGTTAAKKKSTTTAKKAATKKTAAKKAAPKKAATKKSAPKKAAAKKTTTKKATPAKPKAAPKKAKAAKPVSVKELVFKKFEPMQAPSAVSSAPKPAASTAAAPPIITSTDPNEVERLQALLFNKFDMNEIKAAAKAPDPVVEKEPAAEAVAATPAPAPSSAAEEAPAKVAEVPQANGAYIIVDPPTADDTAEPMNRAVKVALAAAAIIVFLLLTISFNNSSKYYIYPKDNAIEIWKGRFSPKDKHFFMVLHGTQAAEPIKATYTKEEVFPLVFSYYVDKADTLLEVPGLPDFEGIKSYLHQAEDYIVSTDMSAAVSSRLNNIERMILLYKADVAISKDTDDSLESAIKLLKKAGRLTPSPAQENDIMQKIEQARARRAELKAAAE